MTSDGTAFWHDMLSGWASYEALRHGMIRCGLSLHERFREEVLREYSGSEVAEDIERFWAAESHSYMAALTNDGLLKNDVPIQDKPQALKLFQEKFTRLQFFGSAVAERMELSKRSEINSLRIEPSAPVASRKDQWRLFREYGARMGAELTAKRLRLIRNSVAIEISMDTGGKPYGMVQPEVSIVRTENAGQRFYLNWAQVLPGFHYYQMYRSDAAAHLAIISNLTIAQLMLDSFKVPDSTVGDSKSL
jgi:hypothetical protein